MRNGICRKTFPNFLRISTASLRTLIGVQGSFVIFGSIALLLLAGALLAVPVRLRVIAATTLHGGRGSLTVRFLFIKLRFLFRLHGLEEPPFSAEFLERGGKRRSITHLMDKTTENKPEWPQAILRSTSAVRVTVSMLLGIADEPDAAALLCGMAASVMEEALALLLPDARAQVYADPVWKQTVFRINLEGIASVRLVKVIRERIALKGEE